jgi:GTP 3',8-cyclase
MLIDTFGRRFYYLRLSVTDICNFRCTYCLPDGYKGRPEDTFLSPAELEAAARGFIQMGTQKIRLTGGEPGLRKDLPEILERLSRIESLQTLAVTTNGYKLPQKIHQWVKSGLTQLNVSIDSLDAEKFHDITGHNRLEEVLEGVRIAQQLGIKTKVNAVLMNGVNDDLESVLKWLKQTPVTMRFIEVMETVDQQVFFRQHHTSGESVKAQLLESGWQPVLRDITAGPAQEFWHPEYQGRIGLIMPYSKDFCDSCNRLRISSLGKLHLCLFAEQGIDVRPYLQPGVPVEALMDAVRTHLKDKAATHFLHEHNAGAMTNLSQIGG